MNNFYILLEDLAFTTTGWLIFKTQKMFVLDQLIAEIKKKD
jgi:hypothetical protein